MIKKMIQLLIFWCAVTFFMNLCVFAAESPKIVRIWHTETNEATQKAIANIAERFEKLHPDIKIQAEALGWNELEANIVSAIANSTPPELSHGQPVTCAALQAKDLLLPLDEVVQSIGEENIWDQVKRVGKFGDHYYGLVHAAGTSLLIYRKDLALKKGLTAPKTWDELLNIARELTMDTDGDDKTDIYGVTIPGDNLFINILIGELIKANGGILFDAEHKAHLTDRQMIETLNFIKELAKYMHPDWRNHGYKDTFANLYNQKAAMMLLGYGRGASLVEANAPEEMVNTNYFDVWVKPHGPSGSKPAAQVDEETWMLFKDSKHQREAIEFLKFFYMNENYIEYIRSVPIHFFPISKSLRKMKEYNEFPMIQRWKGWLDVQEYYLNNDLANPTLIVEPEDLTQKPYLMTLLGSEILKDMVIDVVVQGVSAEQAAAKAQERVQELVVDYFTN